jgi:hypothetical protein
MYRLVQTVLHAHIQTRVYIAKILHGKFSVNKTNLVSTINQYLDLIFILFPTATCFGPYATIIRQYYDRTAELIELLLMDPYLVQHVHIINLCLSHKY